MLQLVWFDQQLRTKKYPTARQFAEHFELSGLEGVKRWVLSCGGQAEVLAPESLRKAVAAEVRRLAAVYPRVERGVISPMGQAPLQALDAASR